MMIINEYNKAKPTVFSEQVGNMMRATATTDGIHLDKQYVLKYTIDGYPGKVATMVFMGWELVKSIRPLMEIAERNTGDCSMLAARQVGSAVANAWASLTIDRSAKMRKRMTDQYGKYIVKDVDSAIKGKRSKLKDIREIMAGYLFVRKTLADGNEKFGEDYRVLNLHDVDYVEGNHVDTWRNQPITTRMGIKSYEEYCNVCRAGSIYFNWSQTEEN